MRIRPSAKLAHKLHRLLNLFRIRIALFDECNRKTVRAKEEMHLIWIWQFLKDAIHTLHNGGDVIGMVVEVVNDMHRDLRLIQPVPFLQAASGGSERIVRIKRQEDEFVKWRALESGDSFLRVGVPVTHRDNRSRRDVRAKFRLQRLGLLLG